MNKHEFIQELSNLFIKYNDDFGIDCMEYRSPGQQYNEEVVIYWKGNTTTVVNVTWDSYIGMLRDVVKRGFNE